jgi:hypothetical protein
VERGKKIDSRHAKLSHVQFLITAQASPFWNLLRMVFGSEKESAVAMLRLGFNRNAFRTVSMPVKAVFSVLLAADVGLWR